jgi:hypothetical protein
MGRLISALAAGLPARGTVLTGDVASADTTAVRHLPNCGNGYFLSVNQGGVNFYLGTPANLVPGTAAVLKPGQDNTTWWSLSFSHSTATVLIENGGVALTSKPASAGADVTLESPGDGGNGWASQQWNYNASGSMVTLQNAGTGLYLRVRNSGPVMSQPVTTGKTATSWNYS